MKISLTNNALQQVMKAKHQSWRSMSGYEIHERMYMRPNVERDLQGICMKNTIR